MSTEKLSKRFFTCTDSKRPVTTIAIWRKAEKRRICLQLVSPWGSVRETFTRSDPVSKTALSNERLRSAMLLLHRWMVLWLHRCARVICVRSIVRRFVNYISKDFYPAGLSEVEYKVSLKIGRLLEGNCSEELSRQMHAFFIN